MSSVVVAVCIFLAIFGLRFSFAVDAEGPFLFYTCMSSVCFALASYLALTN